MIVAQLKLLVTSNRFKHDLWHLELTIDVVPKEYYCLDVFMIMRVLNRTQDSIQGEQQCIAQAAVIKI
jgi:hypothetical protein